MKDGVTVTQDNMKAVADAVELLSKSRVLVGIPSANAGRNEDATSQPITNAALGYIHEYGAPEQNIPARPFLNPGVDGSKKQWLPYLEAAGRNALNGESGKVTQNLDNAGLTAQNAVRAFITAGDTFAPLAPVTLAARQRKGRTGTKPLIDTNQMLKSVTYVVRKDS